MAEAFSVFFLSGRFFVGYVEGFPMMCLRVGPHSVVVRWWWLTSLLVGFFMALCLQCSRFSPSPPRDRRFFEHFSCLRQKWHVSSCCEVIDYVLLASFKISFWGDMLFTATYLANCMAHCALQLLASFPVLFGVPAKLDHLPTFGTRTNMHVERCSSKALEVGLCGFSIKRKAYRIYSNKTGRLTQSRKVIFIETPASTPVFFTEGDPTGDAVRTHQDSSPAKNTDDICITNREEIDNLLKKLLKLTSRNMDHAKSDGAEEPADGGADSDQTLETTQTGALPTDNELGGATRMSTRASGAVSPVSHEEQNPQQQRELRNLGLLTSPMTSDAEVAHENENMMEYALVAATEHRSDGVQERRMEVCRD